MSAEDQLLQSQLALSRQIGELVGVIQGLTGQVTAMAQRVLELEAYQENHRLDHEKDKLERRQLPDELLDYIRKEHAKAAASEKFYEELRVSLKLRGILGVLGLLGTAIVIAVKNWGPSIKEWLVQQLTR